MESDKQIAYRILTSLCESSFVDDLQDYRICIQTDLNLTNEQMNRIYNLKTMLKLILPEKQYKGQKLFEIENSIYNNPLTPLSPLSNYEENIEDV
jgi:hypothetical protein